MQTEATLHNARFLDIGGDQTVVAGVAEKISGVRDGSTYYSDPIDDFDGEVARCGDKTFNIKRTVFHG